MDINKILKFSKDSEKKVSVLLFDSPVGNAVAAGDEKYLYLVLFEDSKNWEKKFQVIANELNCSFIENNNNKILQKLKTEMNEYFDGKLKKFSVPLKTFGSDFQKEVWKRLQEIPYGDTMTYSEFASAMGKPGSARAIGAACGANSHFLIIPCHRLVASGSKGGYSGGVDRKDMLLCHEEKFA